jgi:hypothetical protein
MLISSFMHSSKTIVQEEKASTDNLSNSLEQSNQLKSLYNRTKNHTLASQDGIKVTYEDHIPMNEKSVGPSATIKNDPAE